MDGLIHTTKVIRSKCFNICCKHASRNRCEIVRRTEWRSGTFMQVWVICNLCDEDSTCYNISWLKHGCCQYVNSASYSNYSIRLLAYYQIVLECILDLHLINKRGRTYNWHLYVKIWKGKTKPPVPGLKSFMSVVNAMC